ncbi:MAG: ADP-ribosylglycohydrolase family protein [Chitinispirillaceae bacterium]|nr:ADP-ribosylglycohydrolase family protein [Chitinispirillaceae bacterium]
MINFQQKASAALYGSIIGDALGVPVESLSRKELSLRAVKSMLGYGRYNLPAGTWSDDTSMILCTMEILCNGYDGNALGGLFRKWLYEGEWTPYGYAFDVGLTTYMALDAISHETNAQSSGRTSEDDNGNGSLMRMLPAALWFQRQDTESFMARIHEISAITHAHPRALVGCGIYAMLVRELLTAQDKTAAFKTAIDKALAFYSRYDGFKNELNHFSRILSCKLPLLEETDINSSGYVVDTLEASIWCLLRYDDMKSVIIAAVNLGIDTDTTGSIAGGLAGLTYGMNGVPEEWLHTLARKRDIDALIRRFVALLATTIAEQKTQLET